MTERDRFPPAPRLLLVPAAVSVALIAVPLIALLGHVDWRDLPGDLASDEVRTALRLSVETSTLALAASLLLGLPLAHLLARRRFVGLRLVRLLVVLPLVMPPVVGGIALQAAFGRTAPLGRLLGEIGIALPFTTAGAVLAETWVAMPFLVITVEAGLRQWSGAHEEAAATLGAGPWRRLIAVTLPLLAPSVAAGAALCWARALGEFGATVTFAGSFPGTTQTLPLAAYSAFEGSADAGHAVTLAVILLGISILVLGLLRDRWTGALR